MLVRTAIAIAAAGMLIGGGQAGEHQARLMAGLYEVEVRLEIPNVWNWFAGSTATICVPDVLAPGAAPLPILSSNNPVSKCPAANVMRGDASLAFDIVCEGRNAGRAHARYMVAGDRFRGRIRIVMGAKNMTMTEVQVGRRMGRCDSEGAARSAEPPPAATMRAPRHAQKSLDLNQR
jgi:hypothetical protein